MTFFYKHRKVFYIVAAIAGLALVATSVLPFIQF